MTKYKTRFTLIIDYEEENIAIISHKLYQEEGLDKIIGAISWNRNAMMRELSLMQIHEGDYYNISIPKDEKQETP